MVDILQYMKGDGRVYRVDNNRGSSELMCTCRGRSDFEWFHQKNANIEQLGHDDSYIYRGLDTSDFSGEVYIQYYKGKIGAPWIKRHMQVGEVFRREPEVRWFKARHDWTQPNPFVEIHDPIHEKTFVVTSDIKLVNVYPQLDIRGLVIPNVIELEWLVGGVGSERYFYAEGYGLVRFRSESANFDSWIADLRPADKISNVLRILNWDNPPFPPTGTAPRIEPATPEPFAASSAPATPQTPTPSRVFSTPAQPVGVNLLKNPELSGFPTPPMTFDNNGTTGNIEWPDSWKWLNRKKAGYPPPESYHRDEGYELSAGPRLWEAGYSQRVRLVSRQRYRLRAILTPQMDRYDSNPIESWYLQWRFEVRGKGLRLNSEWTSTSVDKLKQRQEFVYEFEAAEDKLVTVAFVARGRAWDYIYHLHVHHIDMVPLLQLLTPVPPTPEPVTPQPSTPQPEVVRLQPVTPASISTPIGRADGGPITRIDPPRDYRVTPAGAGVNVRELPGSDQKSSGQLSAGTVVRGLAWQDFGEYRWLYHDTNGLKGWSADVLIGGGEHFFREVSVGPRVFVADPNDPPEVRVNELPMYNVLVKNPLRQPKMLQQFGNTNQAFEYVSKGWYDYCQNLHGGVDIATLDNNDIAVRAGVYGRIAKPGGAYRPRRVDIVTADGYRLIYGHLHAENPLVPENTEVTPDTIIGSLAMTEELASVGFFFTPHLHLEVHFAGFIINPLLLMNNEVRALFDDESTWDFCTQNGWTRWQTPYDQPVLRLVQSGGKNPIGPAVPG